jgi:hypothetical protein
MRFSTESTIFIGKEGFAKPGKKEGQRGQINHPLWPGGTRFIYFFVPGFF